MVFGVKSSGAANDLSEYMRIKEGGNVGIGTTSPAVPLEVSGASSALRVSWSGAASLFNFNVNPVQQAGWLDWRFHVNDNVGGSQDIMTLRGENGNVGIGTTSPTNKLSVAGTVQAYEVLVNTGWSDYVFAPNYHLRSLTEVAAYIEQNHHLPDIPSADEVKEKGVSVGDMESKLLAKIEELTLHMIQADDRIRSLEEQNRKLLENQSKVNTPEGNQK
jgi:hypothetical protein